MDELTSIGYRSGDSFLHRLDARTRLILMALIGIFTLQAGPRPLAVLTVLLIIAFRNVGVPLRQVLRDLRWLFLFLFAVVLVRSYTAGGAPVLTWPPGLPGWFGLAEGAMVGWRLLSVALCGVVLIATTSSREVRHAVRWLFRPVPFIDGRHLAVMIGLMIRFLPAILVQAEKTANAQRARCVDRRRNPIFRLKAFSVPFIRRVSEDADRLAVAMEARAFSTQFAPRVPGRFPIRDRVVLAVSIAAYGAFQYYK